MSNHAQALMISTQVHSMFGYALMLAGLTRMIEICYYVPKYTQEGSFGDEMDSSSEHTLGDGYPGVPSSGKNVSGKVFRHLPPYVSPSFVESVLLG